MQLAPKKSQRYYKLAKKKKQKKSADVKRDLLG